MHNDRMITLLGWKSILSISTRYEMTRVRDRAIKEIMDFTPQIDSVDLVVLAVDHQVDHWLPIAYSRLCQRKETLTVQEGKRLGLETVCLLYRARQKVREGTTSQIDGVTEPFDQELVHRTVYEVFWPEQKVPKLESSMNSAQVQEQVETMNGDHEDGGSGTAGRQPTKAGKEREKAEKEREKAEKERERAEKERERAEKERERKAKGKEKKKTSAEGTERTTADSLERERQNEADKLNRRSEGGGLGGNANAGASTEATLTSGSIIPDRGGHTGNSM